MRVLVPLDGSQFAERALPYAAALAAANGQGLVLFHVRTAYKAPGGAVDIEQVAGRMRRHGLDVETLEYDRYVGDTGTVIVAAAHDQHADLIALSTHGRGGMGRWLYGSVADEVIRAADVPILLVPAACERRWPESGPRRILVTLDGSELAEAILGPACVLADRTAAKLILLRVVEPPNYVPFADDPAPSPSDKPEAQLAKARWYVERIAQTVDPAREAEARAEIGSPVLIIDKVARAQDVDFVAMASHGRGGLARLVVGSVATGTLQRSSVPLFLIRAAAVRQSESEPAAEAVTPAGQSGQAPGPVSP